MLLRYRLMLIAILLLLILRYSRCDICPIYCQCYAAFDGFHVKCSNVKLREIPLNLTTYLRTTEHQNLIVDLSSNILSDLPCSFFENTHLRTLILSRNQIRSIPSCFSRSSIENLVLNGNFLEFNQTTILASSKLLHLDLSFNQLSSLPRTFFSHLRKLQYLILDGNRQLFEQIDLQWLRSLTTRNQLTLVLCEENFHFNLCLFEHLFRTKKLFAIELNQQIHCDCSIVYLPQEKFRFQTCQMNIQEGICNRKTSRFEQGNSIKNLKTNHYQQVCSNEYQKCQIGEKITPVQQTSISTATTTTTIKITSLKTTIVSRRQNDNLTQGMIIFFVLMLFIVIIICLYIFLSRQTKSRLKFHKKKVTDQSSIHSSRFDECISIENFNTNFKSYSDDDDNQSNMTFYSLKPISLSTDLDSLTSTIDSSLSNDFLMISQLNKQRFY